jgi:hypothetical protein
MGPLRLARQAAQAQTVYRDAEQVEARVGNYGRNECLLGRDNPANIARVPQVIRGRPLQVGDRRNMPRLQPAGFACRRGRQTFAPLTT